MVQYRSDFIADVLLFSVIHDILKMIAALIDNEAPKPPDLSAVCKSIALIFSRREGMSRFTLFLLASLRLELGGEEVSQTSFLIIVSKRLPFICLKVAP